MQLNPAILIVPVGEFLRGHAHRHRSEEGIARMLADEVVVGPVIHVGLARGDGVEDLEGPHELARGLEIDGQLAVGHRGDRVGAALGRVMDAREAARPGGHQGQRPVALRVERGCQRACGSRSRATDGGLRQK